MANDALVAAIFAQCPLCGHKRERCQDRTISQLDERVRDSRGSIRAHGVADYILKNILDYINGRCYIARILAPEGCLLEPPS